jgi:hypothetical protein
MKSDELLNEFYLKVPKDDVEHYKELAKTAIKLGYNPKKTSKTSFSINFSNSKTKKTILRFIVDINKHRILIYWKLKFYANKNYSQYFVKCLKETIEEFNFKYVGCYGCGGKYGNCKKEKLGYNIEYEDGREYFRCGFELIDIKIISKELVEEAIKMIEIQHYAFEKELE